LMGVDKVKRGGNIPWVFPVYVYAYFFIVSYLHTQRSYPSLSFPKDDFRTNRGMDKRKTQHDIPSAPLSSTITLTFSAHLTLPSSLLAASSNPTVSPHPPIATITFVPSLNFLLTSSTLVQRGNPVSFWSGPRLKNDDGINAIATCVISSTKSGDGIV